MDLAREELGPAIEAAMESHREHILDGDPLAALQGLIVAASLYVWSGAWLRALEALDEAEANAELLEARYLRTWARYTRAKLLCETGPASEAEALLAEVVELAANSPRMAAGARVHLGTSLWRRGAASEALDAALLAESTHDSASTRAGARAVAALACIDLGDPARALELARSAAQVAHGRGQLLEFAMLVRLAHVSALHAAGRADEAAAELQAARSALDRHARSFVSEFQANAFLTGPYVHRRLLTWTGDDTR
jgi:ATP/maltotriose-dependent transcriptional regulator MalT